MSRIIASRISLIALAACALAASAQQPAHPKPASQAGQPQTPQGNLTIQVTSDDGTPVPGAALQIDGMSIGGGHAITSGVTSTLPSGTRITGADPTPQRSNSSQSNPGQSGLIQARARACPPPPPNPAHHDNAQPNKSPQPQSGNGQPGSSPLGSSSPSQAPPSPAKPAQPPTPRDCGLTNQVQAGTAESITDLGGASTDSPAPALPPGAVALETDAQGQLTVQLPPGEHTLGVSVYGFDPWTGHFTLAGKRRQVVQIKLSTAPTSTIIVVGPDGRVQPISAVLEALIPLEPVALLDPLPVRTHRRGI